jgi:tetratricopeptide (TPR) repeat protein
VFAYITEAQEVLLDESQSARYLRSVQDGGGTPNAQRRIAALIEAATDAQKAEVCLRRREFDEAVRLSRKALSIAADDPNSLCVLASALLEKRQDLPPTDEVVGLLRKAVDAAPKHDRARVLLGTVLKRRGDKPGALEQFQEALAANPKNTDAAREIRLAEMRSRGSMVGIPAQPAPEPKKSVGDSFISRFLKK